MYQCTLTKIGNYYHFVGSTPVELASLYGTMDELLSAANKMNFTEFVIK